MDVNGVLILIGEIVAHSPLGEDEFRLGGVALDLFTQPADMHRRRKNVPAPMLPADREPSTF